nr:MAG TPA: N-acetylmuramoyl-L-alanine amidase [Caudoviricetes sp.]
MSYRYETKYTARSFSYGRDGRKPDRIIIHHWGSDGQSHDGVVAFFRDTALTSAHYVASAGRVTCLVACRDTAYHAGDWYTNTVSIGIECHPEMTAGDLETVAELIADIRKAYGNLPLYGHRDVVATECPGRYYTRLAWLDHRARQIQAGQILPSPNRILKPTYPFTPKGSRKMFMLCLKEGRTTPLFAITGPGYWLEFTGQSAANNLNKQLCGGPSLICTRTFWDYCKAAASTSKKDMAQ